MADEVADGNVSEQMRAVDERIVKLESRKSHHIAELNRLSDAADKDSADLPDADIEACRQHKAAIDRLDQQLDIQLHLKAKIFEAEEPLERRAAAADPAASRHRDPVADAAPRHAPSPAGSVSVRGSVLLTSPTHTFRSAGEYMNAVRTADTSGHVDHRLAAAVTELQATQREGVGSDGGFAVPPQYSEQIYAVMWGNELASLAPFCRQMPMRSNTLKLPASLDMPYGGSGVTAYWGGEERTHAKSKINFENVTLALSKLTAFIECTDELLEDSPAMDAFITRAAGNAIGYETGRAILDGSGVGQPKGILNAEAVVVAPKAASGNSGNIIAANIFTMWSRLLPNCQMRARWLISPSAFPQLQALTLADQPIFMPANDIAGRPFGTIFGRPVHTHLVMEPLGSQGDIALIDFEQYYWGTRRQGVTSAMSMHLRFREDIASFKFQIRADGQAIWSRALPQAKPGGGNLTFSPYVTLAAR